MRFLLYRQSFCYWWKHNLFSLIYLFIFIYFKFIKGIPFYIFYAQESFKTALLAK